MEAALSHILGIICSSVYDIREFNVCIPVPTEPRWNLKEVAEKHPMIKQFLCPNARILGYCGSNQQLLHHPTIIFTFNLPNNPAIQELA